MSFDDALSATASALDRSSQPNGGHPARAVDGASAIAATAPAPTGSFHPLDYPLAMAAPLRLTQTADWRPHIPFAFALVEMLRPRSVVELGVSGGDSFCAICQAVEQLKLPTTCVAIDPGTDNAHTGHVDELAFDDISSYVRERYAAFATLWRMTFDAAAAEVEDGSIDLLLLNGAPTSEAAEAARHDFDVWLSKLSPRGVVLLHGASDQQTSGDVHRLWDEISQRYPSCAFLWGHGLGVAAVGAEPPQPLLNFFAAMRSDPNVARYFQILGERVLRMSQEDALTAAHAQVAAQGDEIRRLRDTAAALETRASVYVGEVARLTAENAQLTRQRATFDGQLQSLDGQLRSLRASRVYRASRIMAWPLKQARRVVGKARRWKRQTSARRERRADF